MDSATLATMPKFERGEGPEALLEWLAQRHRDFQPPPTFTEAEAHLNAARGTIVQIADELRKRGHLHKGGLYITRAGFAAALGLDQPPPPSPRKHSRVVLPRSDL